MFDGSELLAAPEAELQKIRGAEIAMVFQDPMSSLDPVYRIGEADRRADPRPRPAASRRRRRWTGRPS